MQFILTPVMCKLKVVPVPSCQWVWNISAWTQQLKDTVGIITEPFWGQKVLKNVVIVTVILLKALSLSGDDFNDTKKSNKLWPHLIWALP